MHPLDHPIWNALTSEQSTLAEGDALARRFPAAIGPLAAMAEQSPAGYESLRRLAKPEEQLVFFLPEPATVPPGWTLDADGLLTQMVLDNETEPDHAFPIRELVEADIPEMLALTRLTKPGPFRQETNTLGLYLGIEVDGRLVAMAGERLKLPGYTEISAVCTHPDFQGRGYAQALILAVAQQIRQAGKIPFLHSRPDNTAAIRVYEKLGFRTRRMVNLAVVRPD